jgi:hypothetical protein
VKRIGRGSTDFRGRGSEEHVGHRDSVANLEALVDDENEGQILAELIIVVAEAMPYPFH